MISPQNITLQEINLPVLDKTGIKLQMLRLDLIHPQISGNKWFKLKYNLEFAKQKGYKKILTFGGAYSNHIVATAAAGNYFGFETIGIIRGEAHEQLNHSLSFAQKCGMQLEYVSRTKYRSKSDDFLDELKIKYPDAYIIPEGGANELALKGCAEINELIPFNTDLIVIACGTGSTLAGIVSGLEKNQKVLGFSVLKGGDFLYKEVQKFLDVRQITSNNYEINTNYHFGGYAKFNSELINFMNDFYRNTTIPLDFVYTAKTIYGLLDLIKKGEIQHKNILAIHSGGLQGNFSIKEKLIYSDF